MADRRKLERRGREKRRGSRRLFLKFRVRPLVPMPKSVLFGKLRHMVHTGDVPEDVEVAYMSYDRQRGQRFEPGSRLSTAELAEFEKFYNVLTAIQPGDVTARPESKPRVRFERPDE